MGYGYLVYSSVADAEAGRQKLEGTVYPHSGQEVSMRYGLGLLAQNA